MARGSVLYIFIISFCAGIAYASFVQVSYSFIVFTLLLLICVICFSKTRKIEWRISSSREKSGAIIFIVVLILSGFALGMIRYRFTLFNNGSNTLHNSLGREITFKGIISDEPQPGESSVKYIIDNGTTKIITTADLYPTFNYGDTVVVKGIATLPEVIADEDTGRSFNYPQYLAKDGIFYIIKRPHISLISHGNGSWIKEKLFSFKQKFLDHIHHAIGEPEASLAGGLIVGAKQSLGKDLEEDFRRAGIIHIVVLSGFNITIIAVAIMKLLSFLPQYIGAGFGITGLILFAILTGGTATVVRSTLMTLLVIVARLTRRDYDIVRGLSLALFVMVFSNPRILMFDPSFQLSFLATFGLILISPHIKPLLSFVPEKHGFREIAVSTLATQIFVLPYLLLQMGELSIVGLIVNFLVLPLIPFTMLCAFLTGALGFIFPPLASLIGMIGYLLLAYELKIVHFFSHIQYASVKVAYFPLWLFITTYTVYIILLAAYKKPLEKEALIKLD